MTELSSVIINFIVHTSASPTVTCQSVFQKRVHYVSIYGAH